MERGSPQDSATSSLEQSKLSSIMPHFMSPRQMDKRPRIIDAEDHSPSYLALLIGAESPNPQQIGPPFQRAPIFTPFGDNGANAQQTYWTSNVKPTTPTPIRPIVIQGSRNTHFLSNGINLAADRKVHHGSKLKRKTVCEDHIAPNPNIWKITDQEYNSRNYGSVGYSVYDGRYQALGLPVDPHLRLFNELCGKGNAGFS